MPAEPTAQLAASTRCVAKKKENAAAVKQIGHQFATRDFVLTETTTAAVVNLSNVHFQAAAENEAKFIVFAPRNRRVI
jgi:hypothetical protein